MKKPLYFDYAATTPVDPRVAKVMAGYLTADGVFGNPGFNTHFYGWEAQEAVDKARQQVADLLRASPEEIIFTSGATESNNLAIKGLFEAQTDKNHLITLSTEHASVLDPCEFLRDHRQAQLTVMKPQSDGRVNLTELERSMTPQTLLISIMHVNNEIGVIQDLQAIGELAHRHQVLFHVDASQSAGYLPIDLQTLPIDSLSISAHKMYGPKGVGALMVRKQLQSKILSQMQGGGQERGLRSGTLATHQIVGMGEAAKLAQLEMKAESPRIAHLRDKLWAGLSQIPGAHRHGSAKDCSPNHLSVSFYPLQAQYLLETLTDLAISSGSACHSSSLTASSVIESLGVPQVLAGGALRFSLGRFTTEAEIDQAIAHVSEKLK
jgi:cysteine desulfurase